MNTADFDFALPASQIAQRPLPERDASRLFWISRSTAAFRHLQFRDLPDLLRPSDLLVLNDARVLPARLLGKKEISGGAVELLLIGPAGASGAAAFDQAPDALEWLCLGQSSKALRPNAIIELEQGCSARVIEALGGGEYRVRFAAGSARTVAELLDKAGRVPLPPYIKRDPDREDRERYQTVYARAPGSAAAPTAGLHFTAEVLARLGARGIQIAELTLDVGPGTFLPVRHAEIERHQMHSETFFIPEPTARAVNSAKQSCRRVVAVGTTVVRALESATDDDGLLRAGPGKTSLFIQPGFRFRQVDALLTNFHLPQSTLLILVSAFLGLEKVLAVYAEAVQSGYRFFSYGDVMLISD